MNTIFEYLTPLTYILIIAIWLYIFVFYLNKIKHNRNTDRLLKLLLIILSIDAFRTIFEGLYFGLRHASQAGFLSSKLFTTLSKPEYVFFPKFVTLVTGVLILVIVLNRWLPAEKKRKVEIEELINQKSADLKQKNKELLKAKDEIYSAMTMLEEILYAIPVRVFWKDKEGKYLGSNQLFAKDVGYETPDELIGKTDLDIFSKEIAELYRRDDHFVISNETAKISYEEPQCNEHRKDCWLSTSKVPLRRRDGEVYGVLGAYEDITAKKAIQLELEEHKNQLESLVKEKTEDLESANYELISKNEALIEKGSIINKQNTELKEAIHQLKAAQSQLVQAEKMASLGTLTAGIAHELNNPLNYILGAHSALELYFENYSTQDVETTDMILNSIEQGVQRATKIISGLNQFSRNNENQNEDCDIHSIINNCLEILHSQYKYKVEITKEFSESDKLLVKGNSGKLHQVFTNILSNSIQAISSEGKIHILTFVSNEEAIIRIIDNGHGITEENLSKVSDPFFTTKDPGEGTGLGLSISYSILQDHKGSIDFESEKDKGTTVNIKLPLSK